jgi:hypothetical protein
MLTNLGNVLPSSPGLRTFVALGGAILALLGCVVCALLVPGILGPATPTPTALAQATGVAGPTATSLPSAITIAPVTPPPTAIPISTVTPPLTDTATPVPCVPNSMFIADVTVPDGSIMAPGAAFLKTWRVKNSGNCAWDDSHMVVFVGGVALGPGAAAVPFTAPGAVADISLPMTAPAAPGSYRGIWRLRAPNGTLFGTNLIALITVPNPDTATPTLTGTPTNTPTATPTRTPLILLDFVKQAPNADWSNGTASLPFQGSDTDPRGFVVWRQGFYAMEDGTLPKLALETHPQWVTGGYIEGYYSKFPITVQKGDRLHIKVGFLQGAKAGDVTFKVSFDDCGDGCWYDLLTLPHAYNGSLIEQVVDISIVVARMTIPTTTFRLLVSANNQGASQDWATWVIAQVERP